MIIVIGSLSIILTAIYTVLIIYYIIGWDKLIYFQETDRVPDTKVSVIVAARNEADNIGTLLQSLKQQDYPKKLFEVIVIDDHSTDDTGKIVEQFDASNIHLILNSNGSFYRAFKKMAIEMGVQHSTGDLIVTTDADCSMGSKWLSTLVGYYEANHPKMIVGPVVFHNERSLFHRFQVLDFMGLVGIGAAAIGNGLPQVCNGANLSYEKKVFEEFGGFEGIDHIASGDDMLLLQKIARSDPKSIAFVKHEDANVFIYPEDSIKAFMLQRMRWASKTTKLVDKKLTLIVVGIFLFYLSFLVHAGLSFIDIRFLWIFLAQFAIKTIVESIFLSKVSAYFGKMSLIWLILPFQAIHILYIIFISIASHLVKVPWKGRPV